VLLDNIIANMQAKGYTSLDVDFEFLGRENAKSYADFVAYCRERLHQYGYGVMTALAPKTSDDQQGALYEGHDYALLGEAADAVFAVSYRSRIPERAARCLYGIPGDPVTDPGFVRTP
jgi:spore germination protein